MRLSEYAHGRSALQRVALWVSRRAGAELDDVAKVSMRRPAFFGRPFLALTQEVLRGDSVWSVGERELFAAVVSRANQCAFCVGTHGDIAGLVLGSVVDENWKDGRHGPQVTATAILLESVTQDPDDGLSPEHLAAVRGAGVEDSAVREALYVAYVFNLINRVADALEFDYRADRDRRRGARILRRTGYRLPGPLMR